MSVPSYTLRALSSPRFSRKLTTSPITFLPFLYQTSTIQQWRRFQNTGDPFPSLQDVQDLSQHATRPPRRTTITDTERKTFDKLLKNLDPQRQQQEQDGEREFPDDFEESDEDFDLDSIVESALKKESMQTPGRRSRKSRSKENINSLAEAILQRDLRNERQQRRDEAIAKADRIHKLQDKEYARVTELLYAAKSDAEVWDVLDQEVFSVVRKLDLDGTPNPPQKTKKKKRRPKNSSSEQTEAAEAPSASEATPPTAISSTEQPKLEGNKDGTRNTLSILTANYPNLLHTACRLLRTSFPTSTLPLALLPTIKSLGRSSYQLGASTPLYNELIRHAWLTYTSYDFIISLLQDMDNGGIEYDVSTLELLQAIISETNKAKKGRYGSAIRAVWEIDGSREGRKKLRRWRAGVAERLQREAIRKASREQVPTKEEYISGILA